MIAYRTISHGPGIRQVYTEKELEEERGGWKIRLSRRMGSEESVEPR
jgi:hypothetical protein